MTKKNHLRFDSLAKNIGHREVVMLGDEVMFYVGSDNHHFLKKIVGRWNLVEENGGLAATSLKLKQAKQETDNDIFLQDLKELQLRIQVILDA